MLATKMSAKTYFAGAFIIQASFKLCEKTHMILSDIMSLWYEHYISMS